MSDDQKKQLESQLWAIANILRGKISANQFQDYILGFIFYKHSGRLILFLQLKHFVTQFQMFMVRMSDPILLLSLLHFI